MTLVRQILLPLLLLAVLPQGWARDLDQDEALALRRSGSIRPVEQLLNQAMQRTINADMTAAGAIAELDRLIANAQRVQATAGADLLYSLSAEALAG